jgi:hypothetical protein
MKTITTPLAALASLALGAGAASAASPAYCVLYAKEFAERAAASGTARIPPERVLQRAYHICLNTDDEPVVPTHYADPMIGDTGGPFVAETEEPTDGTATVQEIEGKKPAGTAPVEERAMLAPEPQPEQKNVATTPTTPLARLVGRVWNLKDPASPSASSSLLGGSGLTMWTPEWKDWCKKRFPNSFDPRTGTVSTDLSGRRIKC